MAKKYYLTSRVGTKRRLPTQQHKNQLLFTSLPPREGAGNCRCLTANELQERYPIPPEPNAATSSTNQQGQSNNNAFNNLVDQQNYGVGCAQHDLDATAICRESCSPGAIAASDTLANCEHPWCHLSWCYVDPNECQLANTRSVYFRRSYRYYSYAACRAPDVFKHDYSHIYGSDLRIGLTSNSGGWTGVYGGPNFEGPLSKWSGPTVDFIREFARRGQINLIPTRPPPEIKNWTEHFRNKKNASDFDQCVYAATLGFIDLCVGQYSVTTTRASTTDFLVMEHQPLYLIVRRTDEPHALWEDWSNSFHTVFQPFRLSAWLFVACCVIPLLGLGFLFHDYGRNNQPFPRYRHVLKTGGKYYGPELAVQIVPLYENVIRAIYMSFTGLLQYVWDAPPKSVGAKFHALAYAFFVLTFLATYTAKLAGIMTTERYRLPLETLEQAMKSQLRLCASRPNMHIVTSLHGIPASMFAVDPIELGGDGEAGFNHPSLDFANRILDFLDPRKAAKNELYCHAAIGRKDELEGFQALGRHCNKTAAGTGVAHKEIGLPMNTQIGENIMPLLLEMKSDGSYQRFFHDKKPPPKCPKIRVHEGGKTTAIDIDQLSGIWFITGGFCVLGLSVTLIEKIRMRFRVQNEEELPRTIRLEGYDQFGEKVDYADHHLDHIEGLYYECEKTSVKHLAVPVPSRLLGRLFNLDDWGHASLMKPHKKNGIDERLSAYGDDFNVLLPRSTIDDERIASLHTSAFMVRQGSDSTSRGSCADISSRSLQLRKLDSSPQNDERQSTAVLELNLNLNLINESSSRKRRRKKSKSNKNMKKTSSLYETRTM